MKLPILENHDQTKTIGVAEVNDNTVTFRFADEVVITDEMLFEIFGNAGIRITEFEQIDEDKRKIKAGQILEFSLSA